jgi:hypothetical protein
MCLLQTLFHALHALLSFSASSLCAFDLVRQVCSFLGVLLFELTHLFGIRQLRRLGVLNLLLSDSAVCGGLAARRF